MTINWFSPVPPAQTEIALHTARLIPALQRVANVRVYTTGSHCDLMGTAVHQYSREECDWPPVDWLLSRSLWSRLNSGANMYNVGNNSSFHSEIWEVSQRHPGVVILHDTALQHLFAGYFIHVLKNPELYLHIMESEYGTAGIAAASQLLSGARATEDIARDFPLTSAAIRDALGVVVHTKSAFHAVCDLTAAPVRYLPLPFPASPLSVVDRWNELRTARSNGPHRLVLFGFLGPNRRIDSILEALADMNERREFVLDIYGTVWNPDYVRSRASDLGLNDIVRLHGYIEDLDDKLALADLALNLRYPSMGEASASQLRIWDHALPAVVTRTGWYAELPSDVVCHVRQEAEVEDLQAHLRAFLHNRNRFIEMGNRGRDLLLRNHSAEAYASGISQIAHEAERFSSSAMFLRVADRVGDELRRWLPRDCAVYADRVIDEIASLALSAESPSRKVGRPSK